jgi:4,5-dihydroxyphthalate decarboxylase
MADLSLVLACWDYDRTRALADGRVKAEGIELTYLPLGMPESFFRMLRHGEFHVSEMSLSWYSRTVTSSPRPFIAIPVFPSRMFRHSSIYVHTGSGIKSPQDLIGRRVGCPEYQMTAAVWIKGILAEYYGVPVNSVSYHTGGLKEPGRREVPMNLPADIRVEPIPADRTLSQMIESGEVDALYTAEAPVTFEASSPNVRRLFADYPLVEKSFYLDTGIFPIMHTVVIRQDVYEANPWVAQSLTKAFSQAQAIAYADLREMTALKAMLPWLPAHVAETQAVMGNDFWAYGLEANLKTLTTFLRYSHQQGLLARELSTEDLFAPETMLVSRT